MKKFMLLHVGFEEPTDEVYKVWMDWFEKIGPHLVDPGNPFIVGREVTKGGATELPRTGSSITGYCIVNADSLDDAEKLLEGCPMVDSIRIYECAAM